MSVKIAGLGTVWASPSTWYYLVRKFGWRRPRLRVHPAKPTVGLRTTRADEMWHIDTTVIRRLDGTRAYLHAVIVLQRHYSHLTAALAGIENAFAAWKKPKRRQDRRHVLDGARRLPGKAGRRANHCAMRAA